MQSRWARVARGSSAALFATLLAAFSHLIAGGDTPTLFGLGASLLLSAALCTLLTTRTLSLSRLVIAMGASQVMFHSLFSTLGNPIAVAHEHSAAMPLDAAPHAHSAMWLAHVVAGALTILAFRYGESAFWSLAIIARLFFARLLGFTAPVLTPVVRLVAACTEPMMRPLSELLSPMRHRGPPVECAGA